MKAMKRIAMLAFPDVQILDVTGPLEVFSRASRWLCDEGKSNSHVYQVEIIGLKPGWFRASCGLRLYADSGFAEISRGVDTLFIAGGMGVEACCRNKKLLRWIVEQSSHVRRLGSICTGAFLLAEAGLLDGRSATTHWNHSELFAQKYPNVHVEREPIFTREGSIYTSAGVTTGMDLALAMVEEDFGRDVSLAAARELVLFLKRPGGQAQLSVQLSAQLSDRESMRDLQVYIAEHPNHDLSVEQLANRLAISPRQFARVFKQEFGTTPGSYVSSVRVETAQRLLEETTKPLKLICMESGLGSLESMRRTFVQILGVTPSQYRERCKRCPHTN